MVDEKEFEEKEYYRKRLSQWRELGFDTKDLEVMLETDFDRLKEIKFDELRKQLNLMTSEELIPKVRTKKERLPRRDPHRVEAPVITEYDDIGTYDEQEEEDVLEEIRKEMERRKDSERFRIHDISKEFRDTPPRSKPQPREKPMPPSRDADYPLISFKKSAPNPLKKSILKKEPKSKAERELELLDEEAALLRRKQRLLEEEGERLHRRKLLLAQMEEGEESGSERPLDEDDGLTEEERDENEPALIFVDRGKEQEEEEEEEEEEHIAISVAHRTGPKDEDELDRLIDEVEDGVDDPSLDEEGIDRLMEGDNIFPHDDDYEEEDDEPPRKRKRKKKRAQAAIAPVKVRKRSKKRPRKRVIEEDDYDDFDEEEEEDDDAIVKKRRKKVKRRRRKPKKKDGPSKMSLLFVVIVAIIVVIPVIYYWPSPLNLDIKLSSEQVSLGDVVTADASGTKSNGDIDSYTWDFGDGTTKVRGEKVTHIYTKAGDYTITLKVKTEKGDEKEKTTKIKVSELRVNLPVKKINDKAGYNTVGMAVIEDEMGIVSYPNPMPSQTDDIKVVKMTINYQGPMQSNVIGTGSEEDGFGDSHQVLHRQVTQDMDFTGVVETNYGSATIIGDVDLDQQIYVDLTTNHTVKTYTTAVTNTEPVLIGGIPVLTSMTSDDKLTSYPDYATVSDQINIEEIFMDRTMDTSDPTSTSGQIEKGSPPNTVIYSWTFQGVENVYNRPAIHLNVTLDSNTLSKFNLQVFYVDLWLADDISTYVKIHTYLEGTYGSSEYKVDSTATMTSFTEGDIEITGSGPNQYFASIHPLAETSQFNLTPPEGDPNGTSHLFTAHEAMLAAMNRSTGFNNYMASGSPYAIAGNYSEKEGPTWNITFGKKGSDSGYNIIVTNRSDGPYVLANQETIEPPELSRDLLTSILTMSSAETIFKDNDKIAIELLPNGMVDYKTTTLFIDAETPYPTLDFTFTSISATEIDYTYTLSKQIVSEAGQKVYSASVNAENGQIMFIQEHTGNMPIP